MQNPVPGQQVITINYEPVGEVHSVVGEFLRVLTSERELLMITREAIFTVDVANVTLICDGRGLAHYVAGRVAPSHERAKSATLARFPVALSASALPPGRV